MSRKYGVSIYLDSVDGELQLSFDCTHYGDQHACPYCLSDVMPPEEWSKCFLKEDGGACHSKAAKLDGLKKLLAFGEKKLKELEEEEDE